MDNLIHVHSPKTHFSYHVILLLLPAIIFVTVLAVLLTQKVSKQSAYTTTGETVLGQEYNEN